MYPSSGVNKLHLDTRHDMITSNALRDTMVDVLQVARDGPVSLFKHMVQHWRGQYSVAQVADKVKRFFVAYARNRHKQTVLTPSYHAEAYSPDDNRFDLRPFLYPSNWLRQFNEISNIVASMDASHQL